MDGPLFRSAQSVGETGWKEGLCERPASGEPKVRFGPVASGDKVIDNISDPFFSEVLAKWPKLLAVEMEGVGAATAIQEAHEKGHSVGFLIIRGLSDMPPAGVDSGAESRQTRERDAWKKYAADTAASFACQLIGRNWPIPPGRDAGKQDNPPPRRRRDTHLQPAGQALPKILAQELQAGPDNNPTVNNIIQQTLPQPASALHQLPSPPADFTGRAQELVDLVQAVHHGGATISALQGQGGVGKTALALMVAKRVVLDFPDAQIYIDLLGSGPAPLTAAQAMAHVLRSFEPERKVPDDEAELAGRYRSLLHGRRVLLLMDNAAGAGQVTPLLPPLGCTLLVTSRQFFTLPGLPSPTAGSTPYRRTRPASY